MSYKTTHSTAHWEKKQHIEQDFQKKLKLLLTNLV